MAELAIILGCAASGLVLYRITIAPIYRAARAQRNH